MTPLFKKLNFKFQSTIIAINVPTSLDDELKQMAAFAEIVPETKSLNKVEFVISFVTTMDQIEAVSSEILPLCDENSVIWYCYPKGTSKRYKCEFNRDNGWKVLGDAGYEGVRMVAVDEDWSALRFKKAENIKTMTRSFAMSVEGKKRTGKIKF